jgi:hypothetical protein
MNNNAIYKPFVFYYHISTFMSSFRTCYKVTHNQLPEQYFQKIPVPQLLRVIDD